MCYSSNNRYNNLKPYNEYCKEMARKYRQWGEIFYQKEPQLEQVVQEKKPTLKDMLTRFSEASNKRHRDR